MPNPNIFCNTPWYEIHVYWDGGLGVCCQESRRIADSSQYNIATTPILEWFNSQPVQDFRAGVLGDQPYDVCTRCYQEESYGSHSRRHRSNLKSAIFPQAFQVSFDQSPGRRHFKLGVTQTQPIDIHVDLGNHCNLSCKMCNAKASSKIAQQEVKWGIDSSQRYLSDWTKDDAVWQRFKQQLIEIPQLNNVHLMGGETLLSKRFEDLVDWFTEHQRFDVAFSFVTNGTVYRPDLIQKLSKFRRVGMEISIECVDQRNAYQRQGTDTDLVLKNIQRYLTLANGTNITVTLRPAVSILTIGSYAGLLDYALEHKLLIKSSLVNTPRFLDALNLPQTIKQQYKKPYSDLLEKISVESTNVYNSSDTNQYRLNIANQVQVILNLLDSPAPEDNLIQLENMVAHCRRWDDVFGYDARQIYPEFANIWDKYGY